MATTQSTERPSWLFPLDARVTLAVGRALRERFRIEACGRCGGPNVFSKLQPIARCFRCGERYALIGVAPHNVSWRRCALCEKQNMAGRAVRQLYCSKCAGLTRTARTTRLRWKAARDKDALDSTNKHAGESEAIPPDPDSSSIQGSGSVR